MAIFRNLFRRRKAAESGPPRQVAKQRAIRSASTSRASTAIQTRIHEIVSTSPPEEALQLVLRAIIEACDAVAAALSLFDPEHSVLRLAAEIGLSDQGCRELRRARPGVPIGWDMPVSSLLNGRVYLIESAAKNRYVPALISPAAAIGTVACIPVIAKSIPLGSLIVVTKKPRKLDEKDLYTLHPALADVAALIVALRRSAPGATSWLPPETLRVAPSRTLP